MMILARFTISLRSVHTHALPKTEYNNNFARVISPFISVQARNTYKRSYRAIRTYLFPTKRKCCGDVIKRDAGDFPLDWFQCKYPRLYEYEYHVYSRRLRLWMHRAGVHKQKYNIYGIAAIWIFASSRESALNAPETLQDETKSKKKILVKNIYVCVLMCLCLAVRVQTPSIIEAGSHEARRHFAHRGSDFQLDIL